MRKSVYMPIDAYKEQVTRRSYEFNLSRASKLSAKPKKDWIDKAMLRLFYEPKLAYLEQQLKPSEPG